MSTPSKSMVHVDRPLTNLSVAYIQSADAFAAARVFPVVPVSKQSDKYFVYNRAAFLRDEMRKRAPGTESAGGGFSMTTDNYTCDVWAYHKDLDNQTLANYDEPLNARRETMEYLANKFLISRERNWVTNFFTTTKWARDKTGNTSASAYGSNTFCQWDLPLTADPIKDVSMWKLEMLQQTGYKPNVLTVGAQVWETLKQSPDILDRVKFSSSSNGQPSLVSRQTIAALFEVDEIIVSEAIYTADTEGSPDTANSSVVGAFIAGKHALLTYRPRSAGLLTPSAGYTFEWTGLEGSGGYSSAVSSFYMQEIKSERIEIEAAYASKVVCSDLGTFASGVIS
jgi:hypothetical protein